MSDEDRFDLVSLIAAQPGAGVVMTGTGGVRKLRFARPGRGKSAGFRVVTFFSGPDLPVLLITIFAKNEMGNLSKAQRNELFGLTRLLIETYSRNDRRFTKGGRP